MMGIIYYGGISLCGHPAPAKGWGRRWAGSKRRAKGSNRQERLSRRDVTRQKLLSFLYGSEQTMRSAQYIPISHYSELMNGAFFLCFSFEYTWGNWWIFFNIDDYFSEEFCFQISSWFRFEYIFEFFYRKCISDKKYIT